MAKFTIKTLIKFLSKFPEDLPIENDLSITWEFPDDIKEQGKKDPFSKEFHDLTIKNACKIFILEGDWDDGTVESFNELFESYRREVRKMYEIQEDK